ncbi:MAG: ChrB protein [Acidobacteria bacterium]|nr:MAG: ChrB protein [Acidobacteriota bacterium]
MRRREPEQNWILLIHQLPPKPTNLRVRTWRKLQRLGAVAIKNSVYMLPFNEKTHEDFQWLKQEIETAGGEATVFRAGAVEGATDEEIITAFSKQRDEDYTQLTAELEGLVGAIREQKKGGHLSAGRIRHYETELEKLHTELERIIATDFFGARNRAAAVAAYERCQKALRAALDRGGRSSKAETKGGTLDPARYQGRRWITRRNLHIDRLASSWLIKRFIDARPRFYFVAEGETIEGGIPFDLFGAELTHVGEDCTFETMLKRFGLVPDPALKEIAEIVHDIDLKDNRFNRLEAAGLNAVVRGLSELLKDDRKLMRQCNEVFDGLYALLSKRSEQSEGKQGDGRGQVKRRAGNRRKKSPRGRA